MNHYQPSSHEVNNYRAKIILVEPFIYPLELLPFPRPTQLARMDRCASDFISTSTGLEAREATELHDIPFPFPNSDSSEGRRGTGIRHKA